MADAPALEEFDDCIEAGWTHFAKTVTDAAEEVLGFAERKNKDCTLVLVINTAKTEVMYQWSGVAPLVEPVISVAGAELQISPQFNYLSSVLSVDCSIDEERNERRQRRHERVLHRLQRPPPPVPELQCPECGRLCGSRIGLYSYRRTHRQQLP
ncbi:hypothetical protein Pcinc_003710 [Petrolisthes cinctipes]|uniref:C2H2-type domain-containing protein n=1 Tax=Petrolisthes cinctipes TaxID=88211 RepID=A0AAE1L1U7_PETCI|nr:hypothetical protein Pcinc_003710 [Petrolisthes cinctipes]